MLIKERKKEKKKISYEVRKKSYKLRKKERKKKRIDLIMK